MKKISWFSRLFMSWTALENYIKSDHADGSSATIGELTNEVTKWHTQVDEKDAQIKDLHLHLETVNNQLKQKDIAFAQLEQSFAHRTTEIATLRGDAVARDKAMSLLNAEINHLKEKFEAISNDLKQKNIELAALKNSHEHSMAENATLRNEYTLRDKELSLRDVDINHLKEKISDSRREMNELKNDIAKKLDPLHKIERTFFAQTGNKGKGELGELQLETILTKSGLIDSFWTKNLVIGNTNMNVEFAIKSGIENKWIPIDSKVLDANLDEDGKMIIDESYKNRVATQVKEVAKYLGKTNTAEYGLLVLQSDVIYMKLFEEFPVFFEEMIRNHKIYVCSPSSFIQFAWSISHILDIYEKVHNDEKIYDQMAETLTSMNKLASKLVVVHRDFNIAMTAHYPTLQARQNKLISKLNKEGKLKELPNIELSPNEDKQ